MKTNYFSCAIVLASFLTAIPSSIREKLTTTNETRGTFIQTKRIAQSKDLTSSGTFHIRPGRDFSWRTQEPFEALFYTTLENYCYSNEDECVTKPLSELPNFQFLEKIKSGDFSSFFDAFDALYKEDENNDFHILAKPKDERLQRVLSRVDVDGSLTNWTLRATFPNSTTITIHLKDEPNG